MKGETINYRKSNGSYVTNIYLPQQNTQVSINSRKYFNYCRNNSSSIRNVLTWDGNLQQDLNYAYMRNTCRDLKNNKNLEVDNHEQIQQQQNRIYRDNYQEDEYELNRNRNNKGKKQYKYQQRNQTLKKVPIKKQILQYQQNKQQVKTYKNLINNNNNQKVAFKQTKQEKKAPIKNNKKQLKSKSVQQNTLQREKPNQSRAKIQQYIKSLIPFTRDLPHTRFKSFFNKQCMEAYGRNNTNQPIGGIIYGNHLKTFNVIPHSGENEPKHYQTHHTALNYAKRTKLNDQQNWKRIQMQYNKKLNLRPVNNTLKQGKNIDVQQINEDNMYDVMRQNHKFAKEHREQIRQLENQYKKQKQQQKQQQRQNYLAQKASQKKKYKQSNISTQDLTQEQIDEKLKNQVIYKFTDQNGITRYASDRHAITCYVDLNFPQNDQVYTMQLMKRNPIFPQDVKDKDRNLDELRRQNYVDSVQYNYPAHYLTPNVDYSVVNWGNRHKLKQKKQIQRQLKYKQKIKSSSKQKSRQQIKSPPKKLGNPRFQNRDNFDVNKITTKFQEQTLKKSRKNKNINQIKGKNRVDNVKTTLNNDEILQNNYDDNQDQNCKCLKSINNGCNPDIRAQLLQKASKDPHLAGKILSYAKKYECELNNNFPTKLIQSIQKDPDTKYPHASHELNPKLYQYMTSRTIPYAGLSYEQKERKDDKYI